MERITWKHESAITLVTKHYAPGYRMTTAI